MDDGMAGFCIRPRGGVGGGGNKCGRWNPTAEQVKVLTELFRSGLRTPSTDQIQKISSQLSFYGKIESKNVFYWFQNHKARERQKRRRVSLPSEHNHPQYDIYSDHENRLSSAKRFAEANQSVLEPERVIETLQLFPLNSFHETKSSHGGKLRLLANEYNGSTTSFPYNHGAAVDDHSPLDLRLSFV